jgi:hypothetical protein
VGMTVVPALVQSIDELDELHSMIEEDKVLNTSLLGYDQDTMVATITIWAAAITNAGAVLYATNCAQAALARLCTRHRRNTPNVVFTYTETELVSALPDDEEVPLAEEVPFAVIPLDMLPPFPGTLDYEPDRSGVVPSGTIPERVAYLELLAERYKPYLDKLIEREENDVARSSS